MTTGLTFLSAMLFSCSSLLAVVEPPKFHYPEKPEFNFYTRLKDALLNHKTATTIQQTFTEKHNFIHKIAIQLVSTERCASPTIIRILQFLKQVKTISKPADEGFTLFVDILFQATECALKTMLRGLFHWQETDESRAASRQLYLMLEQLFKNIFEGKHESFSDFFALFTSAQGELASRNLETKAPYMHMAMNWLISLSYFALTNCATIEEQIGLLVMLAENLLAFLALTDHPFQKLMLGFKAFLEEQARAVQQKEGLLYSPAQHKLLIVIEVLENYTDAASLQRLSRLTCDLCTTSILVNVTTIAAHPDYKFHSGCLQRAMAPGDDLTAADGSIIPGTGKVAGCPMCRGMHPPAEIQVQCNPHGIRFAPPPATPLMDIILDLQT
jgi:hypothetical protein